MNFKLFGDKNDPRPSCAIGFFKDAGKNVFGYNGADVGSAVSGEEAIRLPYEQIPMNLKGRGGLSAKAWTRKSQARRGGKAALAGFLADVVVAEGQALASELDSAQNGECK